MLSRARRHGIARRKIVGGSLAGNLVKLAGKEKGALFSAGKSIASAIGSRVGSLSPKVKQVAADVIREGKDAAIEAANKPTIPEKIRGLVEDLARGDIKTAAEKAREHAAYAVKAGPIAGRKLAKIRFQKKLKSRFDELVGSPQARAALFTRAEDITKQKVSMLENSMLSNLIARSGMRYA